MEFNAFAWNLYRNSEGGRVAIARDLSDHLKSSGIVDEKTLYAECNYFEVVDDDLIENGIHGVEEIDLRNLIREYASELSIFSVDHADKIFTEIADEGLAWSFQNQGKNFELVFGGGRNDASWYGDIFSSIGGLSSGLHDAHPEFFVPYLFARRFDQFEKICQSFDISLPEIPGKLKKRERALYYLAINRALYDFRKHHDLSPQELVAFLYHFAPKNIMGQSGKDSILPPASRVWFVIGGVGDNGDFEYLDSVDSESISCWHGNLETRRGDIILLWCASPRSYLHSIWRAMDDGFNDPYFYFYSLIRVGRPIRTTPIPFAEFSKHPLLCVKPVVRAHFQGASGTPFSIEEYSAICQILQTKGFDVSALPPPPVTKEFVDTTLRNERDVEQRLVEPLLCNLGFSKSDWIRQLPLRMGRGERNYPDYVLGGDQSPGEESAFALIECKFDIESQREIKEAFLQAKSYALRLQASVLALAARRGLWIFRRRDDGFSIDHFMFKTWNELAHPDVLHQVSLIIGRRAIESLGKRKNRVRKKKQSSYSVRKGRP